MSTTKGRNLGLRLDEKDTADLNSFEEATGIEATTLARAALRACLAYWRRTGNISFPLRIVEESKAVELETRQEPARESGIRYEPQEEFFGTHADAQGTKPGSRVHAAPPLPASKKPSLADDLQRRLEATKKR